MKSARRRWIRLNRSALEKGCRGVTEYAAGKGVRTMVENHGHFVQDSDRCEVLMRTVNHPNFGALVMVRSGNVIRVEPVTRFAGPIRATSAVR